MAGRDLTRRNFLKGLAVTSYAGEVERKTQAVLDEPLPS